jgi:hypothetical protein
VKVLGALALARVSDTARAKAMVEELEKSNPTNTVLKLYWLPTLRAAIEVNGGNAVQALESLEAAAPMNWASHPRRRRELCIQPICAAKPTCWHAKVKRQRLSSRSFSTIAAS